MAESIDGATFGLPGRRFRVRPAEGGSYTLEDAAPSLSRDPREAVLEAVSRVSGYARSALSPSLRWEADLGIDRVKRRRISRLLARAIPAAAEAPDGSGTLGDWIVRLGGTLAEEARSDGVPGHATEFFPAAQARTEAEVTALILRVVAEKTGYERELLELDADLEATLGIDTIKQAQIAGQLRRHFPLRFENGMRIKDFPTIRHWIRFVLAQLSGTDAPSAARVPPLLERAETRLELSPPAAEGARFPPGTYAIVDDGKGVAPALAAALAEAGIEATIVDGGAELSGHDGVILLFPAMTEACLELARGIREGVFLVATRDGDGGAPGFIRSLAAERPGVRARAVDFQAGAETAAIARALVEELSREDELEVLWRDGRRLVPRLELAPLDLSGAPLLALDERSVVLITGGTRGIGRAVALDLVRRFKVRLALIGRTRPEEPAGELDGYFGADVTDAASVAAAVAKVQASLGNITGVIHAAGVLEDGPLEDKTLESFRRVRAVKVDGLRNVLAAISGAPPLEFLCAFSSVAARFGNAHQCDYAAANGELEQLVRSTPAAKHAFSIAWGAWGSIGMAARTGVAELLEAAGEGVIGVDEGVARFRNELLFGRGGDPVIRSARRPQGSSEQAAPPALDFLDRIREHAPGAYLFAARDVNETREPWLKDHAFFGDAVVPATFGIELMTQAALALFPDFRFAGLRDLRLDSGIRVAVRGAITIDVRAIAEAGSTPSEREVRVSLSLGGGPDLHSAVILLESADAPPPPKGGDHLLVGDVRQSMGSTEIYARIPLGPSFRVLEEFVAAKSGAAFGKVAASAAREFLGRESARFHGIPLALEAGFHAAALLRAIESEAMLLPKSLGSLRVRLRPEPGAEIAVKVLPKAPSVFDLYFTLPDGRVVAEALDFETQDVSEPQGPPKTDRCGEPSKEITR